MAPSPKSKVQRIAVEDLRLDPTNPRLPEEMDGTVSSEIIRFYWANYVLNELVDSFRENGYFEQEPMIVLPERRADGTETGTFIALEGNRRLAALIQLLRLPGYCKDIQLDPPTAEQRADLATVPCFVATSREGVASHLGFKHIGGIKPWSPEAKARFVAAEVRRYVDGGGDKNPFAHVAKMVGTSAQSVRLAFFALELLRHARTDLGADVTHVANHRFGVWLRAMSSKGVVEKLNITPPRRVEDLARALHSTDPKWVMALVSDLTPKDGSPPILTDSRDVTVYGYILNHERAYKALQETRDLGVAEQIVSGVALSHKIDRVAKRVQALVTEAEQVDDHDEAAYSSARVLQARARALMNTLRDDDE